jgi:hypothetical protein
MSKHICCPNCDTNQVIVMHCAECGTNIFYEDMNPSLGDTLEVLENIEWSGYQYYNNRQTTEFNRCPNCKGKKPNHEEYCGLFRLIAELKKKCICTIILDKDE